MFARVSGDIFRQIVDLINASEVSVNFTLRGNKLLVQKFGAVVINLTLDTLEAETEESFTAKLGGTLRLINIKKDVIIKTVGDLLHIEQGTFCFSAARGSEERIPVEIYESKTVEEYSKLALLSVIMTCKCMEDIPRELKRNISNVTIFGGYAYSKYVNSLCKVRTHDLPDCVLAGDSIKELIPYLQKGTDKQAYFIDRENSILLLNLSQECTAFISLVGQDLEVVDITKNSLKNISLLTKVDMTKYRDLIECICRCYKNMLIELTVCENGIRLFVDNVATHFYAGTSEVGKVSMKLTVAQLKTIARVFGTNTDITIYKGENRLCLIQENSEKTLMLAGMLY